MSTRMMRRARHVFFFTLLALALPALARQASPTDLAIASTSTTGVWKLNSPLPAGGDVNYPQLSPDGTQVVYVSNQETANQSEVFRVPITGGTAVKLNGVLAVGSSIGSAAISPDGSRVIYIAKQVGDQTSQLYSVPLAGGAATRLSSPLGGTTFVLGSIFSPDGNRVIYWVNQSFAQTTPTDYYSVPLTGGTAVKLTGDLTGDQRVENIQVSPDSTQVVYELSQGQQSSAPHSLYHVPIVGGTAVKLDDPFTPDGTHSFVFSPDSSRVIYSRQAQPTDPIELYAAPLNGQPPAKIDSPAGINASPYFTVSPDGGYVVYTTGYPAGGTYELYSTPLTPGGTAVKLNLPLETNATVTTFKVSPDSHLVVYTANHGAFTPNELYSVPIGGGASTKLNGVFGPTGNSVQFETYISPNSQRVVYLADQDTTESSSGLQIYSAPIDGGSAAVKISGPVIRFGFVDAFDIKFTPDSQNVLYRAQGTTDPLYDLFATAADGSAVAHKLNNPFPPMVAGTPIDSPQLALQVSSDSRYVVFRGAQTRNGSRELYAAAITSLRNTVFLSLLQR